MEAELLSLMMKLNISSKNNKFKEPDIVPFEGIQGQWVPAKDFNSKAKTFGYYQCNYCQKTWMSAHSKKSFKQGCKSCERYFYATHLWQNQYKNDRREKKVLTKPHLSELCQACHKGVCNY